MFSKKVFIRGLIALTAVLVPVGFSQVDQTATGTLAATNSLSANASNGAIGFTFTTLNVPVADSSTVLDFVTNDGANHKITVVAIDGDSDTEFWEFTPADGTSAAQTFPVLSFVKAVISNATGNAATPSTTKTELISSANAAGAAVDVVNGINNATGTVTVTVDAEIDQTVVAGDYVATLRFAFAADL